MAPVVRGRKGHYRELFDQIQKQGFIRARIDGDFRELEDGMQIDRYKTHNIDVVVDRFVISQKSRNRITKSVEMALEMADGTVIIGVIEEDEKGNRQVKNHLFLRNCSIRIQVLLMKIRLQTCFHLTRRLAHVRIVMVLATLTM